MARTDKRNKRIEQSVINGSNIIQCSGDLKISEKCDFPSYEEAVQMSAEEFTECVRRAAEKGGKV